MSDRTNISWADHTASPWYGCTKVDEACDHCYAEQWGRKTGVGWGDKAPRVRSKSFWRDVPKWNKVAADWPWKCPSCGGLIVQDGPADTHCSECDVRLVANRPRIFPSLCDPFDPMVPVEWLADFLDMIRKTPNLDWLLLTKRPELWQERLSLACRWVFDGADCVGPFNEWANEWQRGNPPSNVWIFLEKTIIPELEAHQWQPMETAPLNNQSVLVIVPGCNHAIEAWNCNPEWRCHNGPLVGRFAPIKWQPLPKA